MTRGTWSRQWAEVHAHAKDSVIKVATLVELGIDRTTVYRRCRPSGPWRWLLPGIVALHSGTLTDQQRQRGALLFAGGDAVLTGHVAARLHGLREVPASASVPVLIPHSRHRRSAGFVLIERTTRIPSLTLRSGMPCAPVVRAVLDAARRIRDSRTVQAVLAEAVQRRYCTPRQLRAELDAGSQRGSALVRCALPDIVDGARSVAEADALGLWRRAGLPEAEWNVELMTSSGTVIGTPDAWDPRVAFAWEIDSLEYHLNPPDYARTLDRNARYTAHGIAFLQTIPSRLVRDSDAVIAELLAAYAAAAQRPAPAGICHKRRAEH
ncbi:MAG: hypothetical protein ACRDT0_22695 [Pseudonocardiaceae bacterium]